MPASLLERLADRLPRCALSVIYGSTEAEPIAFLDARANLAELQDSQHRGVLVGEPVPEVLVRILDSEILVAGSPVNPGYVNQAGVASEAGVPEAEIPESKVHETLPDGSTRVWHRTGDAGFLDTEGRIWLLGRVGERVGGMWPLPVEAGCEALPFVRRAALLEKEHEPFLVVELVPGYPDDWAAQLRQLTQIERLLCVDQIPLDSRHNAKVDRRALMALLGWAPSG